MLIQGSSFANMAIGSIRSSGRIGRITRLVVNPSNLHIDGIICKIMGEKKEQIIMPTDIRDISPMSVVIDDHDRLMEPSDAIRLRPILQLNFSLHGLNAYVGKKKVGVVFDFAVDTGSLFIQRIYVQPGLLGRLSTDRLVFGRNQVFEITKTKIVFSDSSKEKVEAKNIRSGKVPLPQPSLSTSLIKE